jgi:hypothetical protein
MPEYNVHAVDKYFFYLIFKNSKKNKRKKNLNSYNENTGTLF